MYRNLNQAKIPVKINLNDFIQVSKYYVKNYLVLTNVIVSLDPCSLSSIFWRWWCFRAGFWYKISLRLEPTTPSPTSFASQFPSWKVTSCCTFLNWGLPRLLTLYWIVQQAANMRFDHCDLFSFPPFEGDLVMGRVQGYFVHPQGRQLIDRFHVTSPLSKIQN